MHDSYGGKITGIKFDKEERFVLTISEDGLMFAHLIDKENVKKEASFDPFEDEENLDLKTSDQKEDIALENTDKFKKENLPSFYEVNIAKDSMDP